MKQVWSVRHVASWDGWCSPCTRPDRPLVLTRSGPFGLRAWLTGAGDDERCLLLTCRVCGQWQVVPRREEDDPQVVVEEQAQEAVAEALAAAQSAVPAQAAVGEVVAAAQPAVAAQPTDAFADLPAGPPAEPPAPSRCPAVVLAALAPRAVAATTVLGRRRPPGLVDADLRGVADPLVIDLPRVSLDDRVAAHTVLASALHGRSGRRDEDHGSERRRTSRRHGGAARTSEAPVRAVVPAPRTAPEPTSFVLPAGTTIDLVSPAG